MTHRTARRRLGSRTRRRANTNGKVIGVTKAGRALKRRNPRPRSRAAALKVRALVEGSRA